MSNRKKFSQTRKRNPNKNPTNRKNRRRIPYQRARLGKSRVNIPYLGKIALYWCDNCNLPILEKGTCSICRKKSYRVEISPPGDVRPAFDKDYLILRETINKEYGKGVGNLVISGNEIILLNRVGGLDRSDEVIISGDVIGQLVYDVYTANFRFRPKIPGAARILIAQELLKKDDKRIILNEDGLPYTLAGKSILAPGVKSISNNIEQNDYCLILSEIINIVEKKSNSQLLDLQGNNANINEQNTPFQFICVSVGIAHDNKQKLDQMLVNKHGMLAKNKFHLKKIPDDIYQFYRNIAYNYSLLLEQQEIDKTTLHNRIISHFNHIFKANQKFFNKTINESKLFIKNTINKIKHPVAVAYSGGKDSLGVLLLVWETIGPYFKIFFADTGIELPEVMQNIDFVVKKFGMQDKIIIKHAADKFWDIIQTFGPPARDFRFCCHTLKAQQIMEIIEELYDRKDVLVFLGQRQYESINRAQTKTIYRNSFIPLQVAATPIKTWNSLTLWTYILGIEHKYENIVLTGKDLVTPLYFEGHERLGCYLCPASNLSTFDLLKKSHPKLYYRWFEFLEEYRRNNGFPKAWTQFGLWRFKNPPPKWRNFIKLHNIEYNPMAAIEEGENYFKFAITKGFSPCKLNGYSVKAKVKAVLDLKRVEMFSITITPNIDFDEDLNIITLLPRNLQQDKGNEQDILKKNKQDLQIKNTSNINTYRLNFFSDGSIFLKSDNKNFSYQSIMKNFLGNLLRSHSCNLCGTCISICPKQAISIRSSSINNERDSQLGQSKKDSLYIDPQKCSSCGLCIHHCPLFVNIKTMWEEAINLSH